MRSTTLVKIDGYGMIGDYVPFYFTPKSMMLYNIITGFRHPVVPKRERNEILVIRCLIEELAKLPRWFFTDGQGNDMASRHYTDLRALDSIDWLSIQNSNFTKSDGDFDRPRRYQAEFLVHHGVPIDCIESLNVYSQESADVVNKIIYTSTIHMAVHIQPQYYF